MQGVNHSLSGEGHRLIMARRHLRPGQAAKTRLDPLPRVGLFCPPEVIQLGLALPCVGGCADARGSDWPRVRTGNARNARNAIIAGQF